MSFGKRQLILAALVVSLGAAVYLNWQFSGDGDLVAVDGSTSEKELGTAQLVNGTAIQSENTASESEVSSVADTVSEVDSSVEEVAAATTEDYFAKAAVERQKTRDASLELLQQVLEDSDATEESLQQAADASAAIAQNMVWESNIESLVKAKGYTNCVAFIQDGACSIVVGKATDFDETDAATIRDLVVGQCDIAYDQIKIVDYLDA
jgi:stage III sporulation protein AH